MRKLFSIRTLIAGSGLASILMWMAGATLAHEWEVAQDSEHDPDVQIHLPHLMHPADPSQRSRLAGMEGFGSSVVSLHNLGQRPGDVQVRLKQWGEADTELRRALAPLSMAKVVLEDDDRLQQGHYFGAVLAHDPIAAYTGSEWSNGVATAYEMPIAGESMILPLLMTEVSGQTTVFRIVDVSQHEEPNLVTLTVHDPQTGEVLSELTTPMETDEVNLYDASFEPRFRNLPTNAGDGFIGSLRVSAQAPVVIQAYSDAWNGSATSAYVASPIDRSSRAHCLPSLRQSDQGNSLIAIANVSVDSVAAVTLTYRRHLDGNAIDEDPSPVEQRLEIAANGTAIVDLGPAQRGNQRAPVLTRGRAPNQGFYGSAVISSSQPVAVIVQDEVSAGDEILGMTAYGGIPSAELGRHLLVPGRVGVSDALDTQLVLMNPSRSVAETEIEHLDAKGVVVDQQQMSIDPLGSMVYLPDTGLDVPGQIRIHASQSIAVMAYNAKARTRLDWGRWERDAMAYPATRLDQDAVPPTATPSATRTASSTPEPSATPTGRRSTPTASPAPATWTPVASEPPATYPPTTMPIEGVLLPILTR